MLDLSHFRLTADKAGQLFGQIVSKSTEGAQQRKILTQSKLCVLEDVLGADKITQAVFAKIDQFPRISQSVSEQINDGFRENDLSSVRRCEHAGDTIQRRSEIVSIARLCRSRVDGHAYAQRVADLGPRLRQNLMLRVGCGRDGIVRRRKHRKE